MNEAIVVILGSALVLLGIFGLIAAILMLRRRAVQPLALSSTESDIPEGPEGSPSTAPTDEDLEMVVVREREVNPDGRPRQDIIGTLHVGDPVELFPEAPRPAGRNEIRVVATGGTIGYVPSAKVPKLLDILSEGTEVHSEISHIVQLEDQRGVWINVSVWK